MARNVRQCARPGCTGPAITTITFDGLRRIMWIGPLAEAAAYSAGDLCHRHAERLRPPRNWEVRDLRPDASGIAPAGAVAPSRFVAPPPAPPEPSPFEREGTPARAPRPATPLLPRPAPAGAEPAARTPLLSRAFRNAG